MGKVGKKPSASLYEPLKGLLRQQYIDKIACLLEKTLFRDNTAVQIRVKYRLICNSIKNFGIAAVWANAFGFYGFFSICIGKVIKKLGYDEILWRNVL